MIIKKNTHLLALFLFFSLFIQAQEDSIVNRIVLIGDAGQLTDGRHPVVNAVKTHVKLDRNTTILFLGDNLYKAGLPDREFRSTYEKYKAVLDSQLSVADGTEARVYMIPGNHDWENGGKYGYDAITRQQLYVDGLFKDHVTYFPKDGCPGPELIEISKDAVIIVFDSQWWLHEHEKPEIESDCKSKTTDELVTQIGDLAAKHADKLIIIASHHPFKSNGIHGGFYTLKQHIFPLTDLRKNLYIPLPVIGSIYPISRSVFGSAQDLKHPVYARMIEEISAAVKKYAKNLVFVSGHDHNLQLIKEDGLHYIVSGSGAKQNRTSKSKNSLFNSPEPGFSVMEISRKRNVTVSFYTVTETVNKAFSDSIFNFTFREATGYLTDNIPDDSIIVHKDSVKVPASKDFSPANGLKKLFMGQNYRKEWNTPVVMKVFDIKKYKDGFKIEGLGGGRQTKSLQLTDSQGKDWVLRMVAKSPEGTAPSSLPGITAKNLGNEMVSATYPYAPLVFPGLNQALKIPGSNPELVFVPDDPRLGFYRTLFANTICMLEEKNNSYLGQPTKSTAKLFAKMLEENDHLPEQHFVLQARLLDILTGDYDRHMDQWKWGFTDTGKGRRYFPIPRDRDMGFFYSDGLVLRLVSGKIPFLKGFRYDIPRVNWLGYQARDFDRLFLNQLDKKDWKAATDLMLERLNDSSIRKALKQLPPEIYRINGKVLEDKLISRKKRLQGQAMKYYRFLSKAVNVLGSNEKEYFKVHDAGNGLQVDVYARSRRSDTSFLMYSRVFDPAETREIRLFGLNNDDKFVIDESVQSPIRIRIIGGRGNDSFDIRGNVKNRIYDLADNRNHITNKNRSRVLFSSKPPLNDKIIFGYNYNRNKFPQLSLGYNADDGLLIGAGFERKTFGFLQFPFATDQQLSLLYAKESKAVKINYSGEFNQIAGSLDLLVKTQYASPALRNFFGLGNETLTDKQMKYRFYQTRYRLLEAEALIRKRYFDKFHLMAGPYYSRYRSDYNDNKSSILGKTGIAGIDSADVFSTKEYFGGKFQVLIDNRNNDFFPSRGVYWITRFDALQGLKSGSDPYTAFTSDMTVYASTNLPARVIAILRLGGGHVFSKEFEYFQAINFGLNNQMPGFRKNRFAGSSALYTGIELRAKLFDINSYILPGPFGLIGFYNSGRVWLKNEKSSTWHNGFGGGFYFTPYNLFSITATAGFSGNEHSFSANIGTRFNLSY